MSKNRKARNMVTKVLTLVLAASLVVGGSVAGTLAWLSAKTGTVTNTFTSAELFDTDGSFTLWENQAEDLDEDGVYELNDTEEVVENSYKILPGVNIPKNPTVDVVNLEEHAYLYIKVEGLPLGTGLTATVDSNNWEILDAEDYPGVYVFKGNYAEGKAVADHVIPAKNTAKVSFTATILTDNQIVVADNYNGTSDNISLSFEAYMVQATGNGSDAQDAWDNTFGTP